MTDRRNNTYYLLENDIDENAVLKYELKKRKEALMKKSEEKQGAKQS